DLHLAAHHILELLHVHLLGQVGRQPEAASFSGHGPVPLPSPEEIQGSTPRFFPGRDTPRRAGVPMLRASGLETGSLLRPALRRWRWSEATPHSASRAPASRREEMIISHSIVSFPPRGPHAAVPGRPASPVGR